MQNTDVLIVGAGAAGLLAAHTLTKAGKKVIVLEACDRTGGRIHTIDNSLFFERAELGAEFVHGNLPITLGLLKEAGIAYHHAGGPMWRYHNGTFSQDAGMFEGWDLLMEKLNTLKEDTTLNTFLDEHFTGTQFDALKEQVRNFASGYDTGDPDRLAILSLRREWQAEDEDAQYRIEDGYCALISYLVTQIKGKQSSIYLNAPVDRVEWQPGQVKAYTVDGESYEAAKIIFAIPLGVWQAPATAKGKITIIPPIQPQTNALQQMGFGAIVKVLLQFSTAFWEDTITDELAGKSLKDMGFLFTQEAIPTWWTQAPQSSPLLTGWLGGPAAAEWAGLSNEEILEKALNSLANVFGRSAASLKDDLIAWHVANWTADPYIYGSYAYDTVHTAASLKLLGQPVEDTLYFAGEFMYEGAAMGTVEAALTSGVEVAKKLLLRMV